MPRRPAKIEQDIPLYLIPDIMKREIRTHGDELERVTVRKTRRHFYNVSIRTKPIKRELGDGAFGLRIRQVAAARPGKGNGDGSPIPGGGELE
jgi:hypothetical protein